MSDILSRVSETKRGRLASGLVGVTAVVGGWFAYEFVGRRGNLEREDGTPVVAAAHRAKLRARPQAPSSEAMPTARQEPASRASPRPGARVSVVRSFFPRDPNEWDGGLVPNSAEDMPECDVSARCGMALACRSGRCGACTADEDCAPRERCALDRCLPRANVACTSRKQCTKVNELCLLTDDASPGPRANENLRSICWSSEHAPALRPQTREATAPRPASPIPYNQVNADRMIEELRASQ